MTAACVAKPRTTLPLHTDSALGDDGNADCTTRESVFHYCAHRRKNFEKPSCRAPMKPKYLPIRTGERRFLG
jgi:hypothetical protein